jgi:uncharacterized protein (DUF433 family)
MMILPRFTGRKLTVWNLPARMERSGGQSLRNRSRKLFQQSAFAHEDVGFDISTPARNIVGKNEALCYLGHMTAKDLQGVVHSDPGILGGTPVFAGTRVPLQNLIDYLEGGDSIEDFLEGFPSVRREQVIAVIEAGKLKMLETVQTCES